MKTGALRTVSANNVRSSHVLRRVTLHDRTFHKKAKPSTEAGIVELETKIGAVEPSITMSPI